LLDSAPFILPFIAGVSGGKIKRIEAIVATLTYRQTRPAGAAIDDFCRLVVNHRLAMVRCRLPAFKAPSAEMRLHG